MCIGPFCEFRIAKAIVEALKGYTPNLGELNSLKERIYTSTAGKKKILLS